MERKKRLFIYEGKELTVLLILGSAVAAFAFTMGVHLGKRMGPKTAGGQSETQILGGSPDALPNRQEIADQNKGVNQAADETLQKSLHEEVARTGLKLESSRQIDLPGKTKNDQAGATSLGGAEKGLNDTPTQGDGAHDKVGNAKEQWKLRSKILEEEENLAKGKPAEAAKDSKTTENPTAKGVNAPAKKKFWEKKAAPVGTYQYSLQVGSYASETDAATQIDMLTHEGLAPMMKSAQIKGQAKWYRVYVGGFSTKEEAEMQGAELKKKGTLSGYLVVSHPGVGATPPSNPSSNSPAHSE